MRFTRKIKSLAALRSLWRGLTASSVLAGLALSGAAHAQIDATNWGAVTTPVFNTNAGGVYNGAELFAGPNQFGGNYFAGVLPSGRRVTPAGISTQVGMNPLGTALTPDGRFLITSNDDEREGGFTSLIPGSINMGGYSLSVVRTADMKVVSQIASAQVFVGLVIKANGAGYTAYASGGASQTVKLFNIDASGNVTAGATIGAAQGLMPLLPNNQGYVSNYTNASAVTSTYKNALGTIVNKGNILGGSSQITFPAGSALSPDGRYLYVACNGDNSLQIIDTTTNAVVNRLPVGYFPYTVAVNAAGTKVFVSNWGVTEYKFANPAYDGTGNLTNITSTPNNLPDGFYVPPTSVSGVNPKTSSVTIISVPGGNPAGATVLGSIYQGQPGGIDTLYNVGDTHPSASAVVRRGSTEVLYICKANSDKIGLITVSNNSKLPDFDLSPIALTLNDGHPIHGAYPNAIVASADGSRVYVAEAGLNSIAVLNTLNPARPSLLGRIPTGWYPTALSLSADGRTLYVANAKGIGEDVRTTANSNVSAPDSNYIFGTVQKIDVTSIGPDNTTVLANNYQVRPAGSVDASVVPLGGAASNKIKHVFFILQENKTFDSYLGNQAHFGPFASQTFSLPTGINTTIPGGGNFIPQYVGVVPNFQLLANTFATGVNYYSDSEESDAGHQFCASGTATDYTEKTLLVKSGRGNLVNKNFEPEDYPEGGYLYNNAARNGVSFRLYGLEAARIVGSDTGGSKFDATSTPPNPNVPNGVAKLNDPNSGNAGYPSTTTGADQSITVNLPLANVGDVTSPLSAKTGGVDGGVGHSFFMKMPGLAIVGTNNPNGLGRLDMTYPGYNFNISDQRRAQEFIQDFKNMLANGTLPQFIYLYIPNAHTGGTVAQNVPQPSNQQQVADTDVALGMVIDQITKTTAYYNPADGTGSAIFVVPDDAQSTLDHIHQHRSPMMLISPYAKPGYLAKKHYDTASVVKTEELLLGLPPNNLGDLLATDLRDMFQPTYNGITDATLHGQFTKTIAYVPSKEGHKVWSLVKYLNTNKADQDSVRLGALGRLTDAADNVHSQAVKKHHLRARAYRTLQARIYAQALKVVNAPAPKDMDD